MSMESLFNRLKRGRIYDFPGGVTPPGRKSLSNQTSIASLPLPPALFISVKQHIGVEGKLLVEPGDTVAKGQPLTTSVNPFCVPVHAPTSGTIKSISQHPSAHPSGLPELTVELIPDGLGKWTTLAPIPNYSQLSRNEVINAICNAGISGMGGAGFPTHLKLGAKQDVEFLIINGVECEPYITSDDRLMREHAWQIRQGIDVLVHLLNPGAVLVAVEDNKPEAIKAMQTACKDQDKYLVCSIPTRYPAGGEKQLIQNLLDREVPRNGLPIDVGVIMQNVGTCYAVADAIFNGKPLIERVVTLTGEALDKPGNYWVPIGTPVNHLLHQGGYKAELQAQQRVIMGGPMMGFTLHSGEAPVVKTTNCILVPSDHALPTAPPEQACIRCGACADACPASLLPQQLFWHSKAGELDKAQSFNLFDCIECGACAYVCPSDIPLVHYYRKAKADIRAQEQEKIKADKARERFESRQARLEKEAEERREKQQQAALRRQQAQQSDGQSKDKIAAALARVKAKQQANEPQQPAQDAAQQSTKQDAVAAAVARAKAKKAQQAEQAENTVEPAATSSKQDAVAAAVARAKAKKAQRAEQTENTVEPAATSSKQDAVAAAVARAKAKKAQRAEQAENTDEPAATSSKKDAVAAAVARAKAKKAQRAAQPENKDEPATTTSKQDAVAAAVARAKAKKAQRDAAQADAESPADSANVASSKKDAVAKPQTQQAQSDTAEKTDAGEREQTAGGESADKPASPLADEAKKARVAAAVAKAKAKRLAQQQNKDKQDS